jgi:hypothetical protein
MLSLSLSLYIYVYIYLWSLCLSLSVCLALALSLCLSLSLSLSLSSRTSAITAHQRTLSLTLSFFPLNGQCWAASDSDMLAGKWCVLFFFFSYSPNALRLHIDTQTHTSLFLSLSLFHTHTHTVPHHTHIHTHFSLSLALSLSLSLSLSQTHTHTLLSHTHFSHTHTSLTHTLLSHTHFSHTHTSLTHALLKLPRYTIGKSKDLRTCECPSFYPLPAAQPGFEAEYEAMKKAGTLPTHVHKVRRLVLRRYVMVGARRASSPHTSHASLFPTPFSDLLWRRLVAARIIYLPCCEAARRFRRYGRLGRYVRPAQD